MKMFVLSMLLLVIAVSGLACEPKNQAIDERQQQIRSANTSLVRMGSLGTELRVVGVSIHHPLEMSKPVLFQPKSELLLVKQKLEEFISHGQNVINISNRPDVMWANRRDIEEQLASAQSLLIELNNHLTK